MSEPNRCRRFAPLLALLAVPLFGLPAAEPERPLAGWTLEHETFARPLVGESRVRIVNDFGNVYARTGEAAVEISTVAQRRDGDPYRLLLETRSEGPVLVVEVKARLDRGQTDDGGRQLAAFERRLDLTLFQPPGIALEVQAEDSIETKKLHSDVDLLARKGYIVLDTFGHPRARTFDKEIRGVLRDTAWSTPGEITTRSGDILLYFMAEADVAIEAATMGEITTDYSLDIARAAGSRHKVARAKLGAGHARLKLTSEAGQISILLNV